MLKKYVFVIGLYVVARTLFGQEKCPSFKIRGNKSPRSNAFTTAIKFQLDGFVQYQGIDPQYSKELRLYPVPACIINSICVSNERKLFILNVISMKNSIYMQIK